MSITDTLSGRNLILNYVGLIIALLIYCHYNSDPSMTGWYFTFATIPISVIPHLNRNILERKVLISGNKPIQLFYSLLFPAIFLIAYLLFPELVIILMCLSMTLINLITFFLNERKTV